MAVKDSFKAAKSAATRAVPGYSERRVTDRHPMAEHGAVHLRARLSLSADPSTAHRIPDQAVVRE